MTIRTEQFRALADAQTRLFRQRLCAHLRAEIGGEVAEQQLIRCIAAAEGFGLKSARDVAQFAEITWRHAGCYPDHSFPRPALAILMAHGLDPARKLARYAAWTESLTIADTSHA